MHQYFCPVCWRPVERTPAGCIRGHLDKANGPCVGSYEPFQIALMDAAPRRDVDFVSNIPKWWPKRRRKGHLEVVENA